MFQRVIEIKYMQEFTETDYQLSVKFIKPDVKFLINQGIELIGMMNGHIQYYNSIRMHSKGSNVW